MAARVAAFVAGAAVGYVLTRAAWISLGWAGVVPLVLLLAIVAYVAWRRGLLLVTIGLAAGAGASVGVLSADDDVVALELVLQTITGAIGAALLVLAGGFVSLAVRERRTSPRVAFASALLSALGSAALGSAVLAAVLGFGDAALVGFLTSAAAFLVGGRLAKRAPE